MRRLILCSITILLIAQTAWAQRQGVRYLNGTSFRVKQMGGYDPNRRDGKCTIRVRIDNNTDVILRGDEVTLSAITGAVGRDEGSECNAPLPRGGISNFQFRGVDGRGQVKLVQEPRQSNRWTAIVNVVDSKGGDEGYTFDLTWNYDGSGGNTGDGGFFPGGGRPGNRPGGGNGQNLNLTQSGRGQLDDGNRSRITQVSLDARRGRQATLRFQTNRGEVQMSGDIVNNSGSLLEIELRNSNAGNISGRARVSYNNNQIDNVAVENGQINGRSFQLNFSR